MFITHCVLYVNTYVYVKGDTCLVYNVIIEFYWPLAIQPNTVSYSHCSCLINSLKKKKKKLEPNIK